MCGLPFSLPPKCRGNRWRVQSRGEWCWFRFSKDAIDPAVPLLRIYPKELKTGNQRNSCTRVFTAALFTITKRWERSQMSISGWVDKQNVVCHVEEYGSAVKRSETWLNAARWVSLRSVLLRKRSQTQLVPSCVIPFVWNIHRYRKWTGCCRAGVKGENREWLVLFGFGSKENVLEPERGSGHKTLWVY